MIYSCAMALSGCAKDFSATVVTPLDNPRELARQLSMPAVGQSIIMMPVSAHSDQVTSLPLAVPNIFLKIQADAQPLDWNSKATLLFYKNAGDLEPVYSFKISELQNMAQSTRCSNEVKEYLKGVKTGETLFCNESLDLSKVHHFVLKESETDMDFATSYTIDFTDKKRDVIAITITFN